MATTTALIEAQGMSKDGIFNEDFGNTLKSTVASNWKPYDWYQNVDLA